MLKSLEPQVRQKLRKLLLPEVVAALEREMTDAALMEAARSLEPTDQRVQPER